MDILHAVIVGIVQGLTEFLPISSSAHLIFVHKLLGVNQSKLAFDVLLHLGTLFAVVSYFFKDIVSMMKAFIYSIIDIYHSEFKKGFKNDPYKKLVWMVIVGTLPASIVGLLFNNQIESMFQNITIPALFLIITGILLYISQHFNFESKDIKNSGIKDSIIVGIGQAFALLPGLSRSGSTIAIGLLIGLNKNFAAKFSFFLAIPTIFGATLIQLNGISAGMDTMLVPYVSGLLAAFISGYLAIGILLKLITKKLNVFVCYCLVVGTFVLIYSLLM